VEGDNEKAVDATKQAREEQHVGESQPWNRRGVAAGEEIGDIIIYPASQHSIRRGSTRMQKLHVQSPVSRSKVFFSFVFDFWFWFADFLQRRKYTQECVFAPYFPPDLPQKAYEVESCQQDPVYGCVGLVSLLQYKLREVNTDLMTAQKELSTYIPRKATITSVRMVSSDSGRYGAAPGRRLRR
jgi:hypothetical protein